MFSLFRNLTIFAALCLVLFKNVATQFLQSAKIVDNDNRIDSAYNEAHGFRSCGGGGTLVKWTAEACKNSDSTCEYPIDGATRSAKIIFIPSENIEQLGLQLFVSVNGGPQTKLSDMTLEHSSVKAGQEYVLVTSGTLSEGVRGVSSTAQLILYRVNDGVVEICAEADFKTI